MQYFSACLGASEEARVRFSCFFELEARLKTLKANEAYKTCVTLCYAMSIVIIDLFVIIIVIVIII